MRGSGDLKSVVGAGARAPPQTHMSAGVENERLLGRHRIGSTDAASSDGTRLRFHATRSNAAPGPTYGRYDGKAVELTGHRKRSVIFWIALGSCLVVLAATLNIGWLVANWRSGVLLMLGVMAGLLLIAGLVLNTVFLVREIRRNEKHDAFINAVTHELKTPVASLRLYLETVQSRQLDPDRQREFHKTMLLDMDRLQGTIEQVLLAGAVGSRRSLQRTPVDIPSMVRECVDRLQRSHDLPPDALQYSSRLQHGETAVVLGNGEELRAAVSNLIDNSIKYSSGQVRVWIEIAKLGAARVSIRIRDNGIGIDRDELKRIFRRFYRIQGALRAKGTGLGLYIVRSVAHKHGGRAFGQSEGKGRGSTFTIELPLSSQA